MLCRTVGCGSPSNPTATVPFIYQRGCADTNIRSEDRFARLPVDHARIADANSTGHSSNTQPDTRTAAPADPGRPTPPPTVRLMAVGDVMLGWEVGRKIVSKGLDAPWKGVAEFLDQADLVVANLDASSRVSASRGRPS